MNLGRLAYTLQCKDDLTFCALNSSFLVASEMTSGILVATVPTLGVLRCGRRDKTEYQAVTPDIGLPTRPRRRKPITLGASLFSSQGTKVQSEESENPTNTTVTDMGSWTEIGTGESSAERVTVETDQQLPNGGILMDSEYTVTEWRK